MTTKLALAVALLAGCGDDEIDVAPDAAPPGDEIVLAVHEGAAAFDLAADDDGVYYAISSNELVGLMALDTGATTPRLLHQGGQDNRFLDIETAGDEIVYLVHNEFDEAELVYAVPRIGGDERVVYDDSDDELVRTVAAGDGVASYVAARSGKVRVVRVDLDTGVESSIQPAAATSRLAVDATHTYWTQPDAIWRSDGVTAELFATTASQATALTHDDSRVYWIDDDGLCKLAKASAGAERVLVDPGAGPADRLVVDDDRAYWLNAPFALPVDGKAIFTAPLDGLGERAALVTDDGLNDVAVTSAGVVCTISRDSDGNGTLDQGLVMLLPRASL